MPLGLWHDGGTCVASEPMVQVRVELKMQKLSLPLPLGFQTLPTVLEAQALHLPPGQVPWAGILDAQVPPAPHTPCRCGAA